MTSDNKLEQIQKWIGTMSYYNAAESPSWGQEASKRKQFKDSMAETVKSWNITEEEFIDLYNKCSEGLCRVSEFTYAIDTRNGFKKDSDYTAMDALNRVDNDCEVREDD